MAQSFSAVVAPVKAGARGPTLAGSDGLSSSGLVQRTTRARPGGESAPERIVYATAMRGTARARSEIRVRILSEEEPQEHHES